MRVLFLVAVCAIGAMADAVSAPSPPALTQADLDGQKELFQIKLDALKDAQQKDVDTLRMRLDYIDKRVDDQNTHAGQGVDRLGVYASVLGVLVTLLLAVFGVIGFINVDRRTKEEAQKAATAWFLENSKDLESRFGVLQEKIENLERHAASSKQKITDVVEGVQGQADQARENIAGEEAQAIDRLRQIGNSLPSDGGASVEKNETEFLDRKESALREKPEDGYSFEDWNFRALHSYLSENFEEAAYFWIKASEAPDAKPSETALALVNRGSMQARLRQEELAIVTYSDVVRRYADALHPELRAQVARALIGKGLAQIESEKEAALVTFNEVESRYGKDTENRLREQVARALVNKGVVQRLLGEYKMARATFEQVISRYVDLVDIGVREQVANARNGLGVVYIFEAKQFWQIESDRLRLLSCALIELNQAVQVLAENGVVMGNCAYVACLQGDLPVAEERFFQALNASDHGGDIVYREILRNLDLFPNSEDKNMRALVERLWQAHKPKA